MKTENYNVPWWSDESEAALKAAKNAKNKYKRHKTEEMKTKYNKARAKLRRTFKTSQ